MTAGSERLTKHECWLSADEVRGDVAIKSFKDDDGHWHWLAIRIRDLQPIAGCCHKIQAEARPS